MILLICFTLLEKTGFIYGHIVSFETAHNNKRLGTK
jgi:hypothetical protein